MPTGNLSISLDAGGVSIQKSMTRTGDGTIGVAPTLAVAHAVSSWVKTDADTAAGNLSGGHGLSNGTYDFYWTGGARYDVPVTISTNALTIDGGAGDDFPATANATVVMAPQTTVNVSIDGDRLEVLAMLLEYAGDASATSRGRVLFEDAAGDDIVAPTLVANVARLWDIDAGQTNSFTGDPIVTGKASHENTSYAATLKICGIVDATP